MNIFLLSLFGIFFSLFIYVYFCLPYINNYQNHQLYEYKRKKIFLLINFIILFYLVYASLGAFQFIETDRLIAIEKANDLPRYKLYYKIATECSSFKEALNKLSLEPLFTFLYYACGKISKSFSFFLFLFYSFNFISWYIFLKRICIKFNIITAFSFFSLIFSQYLMSFCLLRMGVAISIGLWVYIFLIDKKIYKALVSIILAVLVHNSSIFLFFPFFLYIIYLKKGIKKMFFGFLIFFILGFLLSSILPTILPLIARRYLAYMNGTGVAVSTYLTNAFFILLIYIKRKTFFNDEVDYILFVFLLSSLFILDLQLVISMFYRMIYFTQPALFVVIGKVFSEYKLEKKHMERNLIIRLFIIFYLFFYYYKFSTGLWEALDLIDYRLDFNFFNF